MLRTTVLILRKRGYTLPSETDASSRNSSELLCGMVNCASLAPTLSLTRSVSVEMLHPVIAMSKMKVTCLRVMEPSRRMSQEAVRNRNPKRNP